MVTTKRRTQAPEIRREQVLDAATAVLLERGLTETTIADIAASAGLGKGTVYLYFDSKQAVLAGLRQRYVEDIERAIRSEVDRATSSTEKIEALVRGLIHAGTRHVELHHVLFHEAGVHEEDAFAPIRALFAEVIDAGGFDVADRRLAADFVLGGVHASLTSVAHMKPARRKRAIDETSTLAIRALGGG